MTLNFTIIIASSQIELQMRIILDSTILKSVKWYNKDAHIIDCYFSVNFSHTNTNQLFWFLELSL